mmetsp:Transcript_23292/g.51744  ORF Transcript_23292/g.51744 Transcript_23292/m.51744 type:complete len:319 (+) Transcript_23292:639-1595(+)
MHGRPVFVGGERGGVFHVHRLDEGDKVLRHAVVCRREGILVDHPRYFFRTGHANVPLQHEIDRGHNLEGPGVDRGYAGLGPHKIDDAAEGPHVAVHFHSLLEQRLDQGLLVVAGVFSLDRLGNVLEGRLFQPRVRPPVESGRRNAVPACDLDLHNVSQLVPELAVGVTGIRGADDRLVQPVNGPPRAVQLKVTGNDDRIGHGFTAQNGCLLTAERIIRGHEGKDALVDTLDVIPAGGVPPGVGFVSFDNGRALVESNLRESASLSTAVSAIGGHDVFGVDGFVDKGVIVVVVVVPVISPPIIVPGTTGVPIVDHDHER